MRWDRLSLAPAGERGVRERGVVILASVYRRGKLEARLGSLWLQPRDSGDEKKDATPLRGSLGRPRSPASRGDQGSGRQVGRFRAGRENQQHG